MYTSHRPETLASWRDSYNEFDGIASLHDGFSDLPYLGADPLGLWPAQAEAIRNLEVSFKANRPRALIQMATGAGKTFTAANVSYRLLRHARANRILFLVDRANFGRQAVREFEGFEVPGDRRKFTELYNVRRLASSQLDMANEAAAKVHVSTIQRLYSILRGEELYEALDERSGFDTAPEQPMGRSLCWLSSLPPAKAVGVPELPLTHSAPRKPWKTKARMFDWTGLPGRSRPERSRLLQPHPKWRRTAAAPKRLSEESGQLRAPHCAERRESVMSIIVSIFPLSSKRKYGSMAHRPR